MPSVRVNTTIVGGDVQFSNPTDPGVTVDPLDLSHLHVAPNPPGDAYAITFVLQNGVQFNNSAIIIYTPIGQVILQRDVTSPSECTVLDYNGLTFGQGAQLFNFSMSTTVAEVGTASIGNFRIEDPTIINEPPPG